MNGYDKMFELWRGVPLEITAFKKEVAKIGLSAESGIRFYYVSGKVVRKIVLNLSNLQTCRPNMSNNIPGAAAADNADSSAWSVDDRSQHTQQCDKDAIVSSYSVFQWHSDHVYRNKDTYLWNRAANSELLIFLLFLFFSPRHVCCRICRQLNSLKSAKSTYV